MTQIPRIRSATILRQARDYEIALQVFLREPDGLTRTGFTTLVLDVGTERARRLIVSVPVRGTQQYPLHSGDGIECFFEVDGVGFAFSATVRERVRFKINDRRLVAALVLDYPQHLLKIQRRAYYRAAPPPDPPVTVHLRPARPDESSEDRLFATEYPYRGRLQDISGAGIAVHLEDTPAWEPEITATVTVAFQLTAHDANQIVLETRVRAITESEGDGGCILRLAWVNCSEEDEATSAFARRIFRYVAERQRQLSQQRGSRARGR